MNTFSKRVLAACVTTALLGGLQSAQANETVYDALASSKAFGSFDLRYETVEQDNARRDASALTLRSRFGFKTGSFKGFSAHVEAEDNRIVLGQGDYSVPFTGYNGAEYSVIADPEHTELDQAFVQYKGGKSTFKVGRQVITHDGHRHIGHVGWRNDRQTFDGVRYVYADDAFSFDYSYLTQINRIFAEAADFDANNHLIRASYKTSLGTVAGYAYLYDHENQATGATIFDAETYGVRFSGQQKADNVSYLYEAEYATQSNGDFDADYLHLSGGVGFSGVTAKLGYEVLGSDDGQYGFATPLATLHKFNGWADIFLGTGAAGLKDTYVSLGGKLGPGKFLAVYHSYSADVSSETMDDLGSEINLQYSAKIGKNYSAAIKYASYSADDRAVDTDKLWIWFNTKF
ncbi:alginate export family protein [Agaribacter flavus]|uniref:Alginate export family protein n=1 Tax=Agaribacter flavus TaxID=1902781 RepID=A0ABV7FM95_9ALTE